MRFKGRLTWRDLRESLITILWQTIAVLLLVQAYNFIADHWLYKFFLK